jgi:hypothetical protein
MKVGLDYGKHHHGKGGHFQGNWNPWRDLEELLDPFRRKTWITESDLTAVATLWGKYAQTPA